jgi:hypothetical protein
LHRSLIAAAIGLAALAAVPSTQAQSHFTVGVITCTADGAEFIDSSTERLDCHYTGFVEQDTWYRGTIRKLDVDLGSLRQARIAWAVLAPDPETLGRFLTGTYVPLGTGATADGGVGAKALIGGEKGAVILQPLRAGSQEGVSIAGAVVSIGFRHMRRPRPRD